MGGTTHSGEADDVEFDPWYRWGVRVLYLEMLIAIGITVFALYMAFSGSGGLGGH